MDYRYCSEPLTVRILDLCRVQYPDSVEDVGNCDVITSDGICFYVHTWIQVALLRHVCLDCSDSDAVFMLGCVSILNRWKDTGRRCLRIRLWNLLIPHDDKLARNMNNDRTKCWTESPDGPFRNGSRIGGGSVNIAVRRQEPMQWTLD